MLTDNQTPAVEDTVDKPAALVAAERTVVMAEPSSDIVAEIADMLVEGMGLGKTEQMIVRGGMIMVLGQMIVIAVMAFVA